MSLKRAVITGMGAVSPLGYGVEELISGLESGRCATRFMQEWAGHKGLNSKVAAPLALKNKSDIPRKYRRTMSPMSIFAAQASDQALESGGIERAEAAGNPRFGCIIGHTSGSPQTLHSAYTELVENANLGLLGSSDFFRCISHTAALNVAQYLGITGTVMASSAACASGLQAVGAGTDLIRTGRQDVVLCGGAEELHMTVTGSFDILFATSTHYNDTPAKTPRPFDRDRDGLVCGEGAGMLLLEEYGRAKKRGATILAEITGYHTCGNGAHISRSNPQSMELCMATALASAGIQTADLDYVNAHATGTEQGDSAEARALAALLSEEKVPVSGLKGYLGHTLGASGPIELICSLAMMEKGLIYPTLNLDNIAEDCAGITHVREPLERPIECFLKNSFAFGGINAAIVCRKV